MPRLSPSAIANSCPSSMPQSSTVWCASHFQVAGTAQFQIHDRVLREQSKHVVQKRDAGPDRGFALAVQVKANGDAGLFGVPRDSCQPTFMAVIEADRTSENKPNASGLGCGGCPAIRFLSSSICFWMASGLGETPLVISRYLTASCKFPASSSECARFMVISSQMRLASTVFLA